MTVILSLMSDQRMQQVIPLLQRGLEIDRLVLVVSKKGGGSDPRYARAADELSAALRDRVEVVRFPDPVDPMDPSACEAVVRRAAQEQTGEVMINVTGGTKLMALGAWQAAQSLGLTCLYVDTHSEKVLRFTGGRTQLDSFDLEPITVAQVLELHGGEIDDEKKESGFKTEDLEAAHAILHNRPQSLYQVTAMVSMAWDGRRSGVLRRVPVDVWKHFREMVDSLAAAGLIKEDQKYWSVSEQCKEFLDGLWLEAYTFVALQESGKFMDVDGRFNLKGVKNEIDVGCVINGKLGIIECKRTLADRKGQDLFNRMQVLRGRLGGTFGKAFFVTALNEDSIDEVTRERAKAYGAKIIGMGDLARVEEIIAGAI